MGKYTILNESLKRKRTLLSVELNKCILYDKKERKFNRIKEELADRKPFFNEECSNLQSLLMNPNIRVGSNKVYYEKLLSLKSFFPDLLDLFNIVEKVSSYDFNIINNGIDKSDIEGDLLNKLKAYQTKLGIPTEKLLFTLRAIIEKYNRAKYTHNENVIRIMEQGIKLILNDICVQFINYILSVISDRLKLEKKDIDKINKEEDDRLIKLIDKYYTRFSDDAMTGKFNDSNELVEFEELVSLVVPNYDEVERILLNVKDELPKEEKIGGNFNYLDLSQFTEEEQEIIREYRELVEDVELINLDFITYATPYLVPHVSYWEDINDVRYALGADSYGLKSEIKDEIIEIYKLVIKVYKEYSEKKIRQSRVDALNRIIMDFSGIIEFIKKTSFNYDGNNSDIKELEQYLEDINYFDLPYAMGDELENEFDSELDIELEEKIKKYKGIITKWKRIMTAYYNADYQEEESIEEGTDNLVFCLPEHDFDLEDEGYVKEFVGAIGDLENKSSQELKSPSGRKSMAKIRKSTRGGRETDFIVFLTEMYRKKQIKFHFTPYRYSSSHDYRTGLIKFEPSSIVKKHLDERYGLTSNQSTYYGVFMIIPVLGDNHSEYARFEKYIVDNCLEIERIARLFASDDPDYEELDKEVDKMLSIKKDLIGYCNKDNITK